MSDQPHPIDLVHQLHEAMYGYSVATVDTPGQMWHRLLDRVSRNFCTCPPTIDPATYDCEVCAAAHRRSREHIERLAAR